MTLLLLAMDTKEGLVPVEIAVGSYVVQSHDVRRDILHVQVLALQLKILN